MATNQIFGHVSGISFGTTFLSYKAMNIAGIHRSTMGGISGPAKDGADSLVISGGYEDDIDQGDVIIYTGQGGQDQKKNQIKDQTLERGNAALVVSQLRGLPVRVIRGEDSKNKFAPTSGYRYDGLYRVESHWHDIGIGGFKIWRFKLEQLDPSYVIPTITTKSLEKPISTGNVKPGRTQFLVQRIIRDTVLSKSLKEHYNYECQICGEIIKTANGFYAEAAHITPLGAPHNGPDVWENILCLCPNHHVMFDLGTFSIKDDYTIIGIPGKILQVKNRHIPDPIHLKYHREHYFHLMNTSTLKKTKNPPKK
jgi:putative restriction endonuclease